MTGMPPQLLDWYDMMLQTLLQKYPFVACDLQNVLHNLAVYIDVIFIACDLQLHEDYSGADKSNL